MQSDEHKRHLEMALTAVGFVLTGTVIIRCVGGLLAAAGVSSFHINLGATSGSGLVVRGGLPLPTSVRLEYGTSWADMASGLALLGAIGVIAVPRMVWDLPTNRRWSGWSAKSVVVVGATAVVAAISALIGTANWAWNADRLAGPAEAVNIAAGVSAAALAALCAVLSWFALPYAARVVPPGSVRRGSRSRSSPR